MIKPSLFVAVPCAHGTMSCETARTLLRLGAVCRTLDIPCRVVIRDEPFPHAQERDHLAAYFLTTQATHLLFIDNDVGFDAGSVVEMLRAAKPIVGLACPQRRLDGGFCVEGATDVTWYAPGGAAKRVKAVGMGCVLIERSVFETLTPDAPVYHYDILGTSHAAHQFFQFALVPSADDPKKLKMEGEDFGFCHRAGRAGFETWILTDSRALCRHVGTFVYSGEDMLDPALKSEEQKEAAE